MSSLFRTSNAGRVNTVTPPVAGLRIQNSVQGQVRPIGYGQQRTSGNLIWYDDFAATAQYSVQGGSGGGKGGGSHNNATTTTSYTYSAAVAYGICEGPIANVLQAWNNQSAQSLASLNLTAFLGDYGQVPWGYLTSKHPGQDLNYRGIAYTAAGPMQLGSSASLPNLTFEVLFGLNNAYSGVPDCDPSAAITDFLTNNKYGAGFPAARVGDLSIYSLYCRAAGMVISDVITQPRAAADWVKGLLEATNAEAVWSAGKLTIVPYGDQAIAANGAAYNPPAAPEYDLGDDDFLAVNQGGGSGNGPITVTRSRSSDQFNSVKIEYLDRTNNYNPAIVEAKDDAAIQAFGLRSHDTKQAHFFCLQAAALQSASLALGRQLIRTQYSFTVGAKFILLDPMDLITLTDANLGLVRQWVRVLEIQENADKTLTLTCEEYLAGTGAAPLYGSEINTGYVPNYNVAPGNVNAPVIFEPSFDLAQGMEIWCGVSGVTPPNWGGCEVWISYDNVSYALAGRQVGPSRMGVLAGPLAAIAGTTPTVDDIHTLTVDLTESQTSVVSVSETDELALNTLCFVGGGVGSGELLSYRDATLTSAYHYSLNHMLRGAYGTTAAMAGGAHLTGSAFLRLDDHVLRIPYDQTRIGAGVYLKFLSFNPYGFAQQSLADVSPYTWTIQGLTKGATTVSGFAVTAISITGANSQTQPALQCAWTPITNSAVVAVVVEYYTEGSNPATQSTQVTFNNPASGSGVIASGIQPSTVYHLRATIVTDPSLLPSTFTGYVTVTSVATQVLNVTDAPPTSPTGLTLVNTAIVNADGTVIAGISAGWTAVASVNLSYYDVQLNTGSGFVSFPSATTSYKWTGLTIGTTVQVRVRSVSRLGALSVFSSIVSITVSGTATAPGAPTGLTTKAGIKTVGLSWTNPANPDFDYIEVWRSTVNDRTTAVLIGEPSASSYADTGLLTGQTYFYWIRAVNTSGLPSATFFPSGTTGVAATTVQAQTGDLAVNSVVADTIFAGAITAAKMAAASITAGNAALDVASIKTANIQNLAVDTLQLAGSSVSVPAIAVDTSTITNGTFTASIITMTVQAPAGTPITVYASWSAKVSYIALASANIADLYINGVVVQEYSGPVETFGIALTGAATITATGSPQSIQVAVVATLDRGTQIFERLLFAQAVKR